MQYQVIPCSDDQLLQPNGMVRVNMTINDNILSQDFPPGESEDEFEQSVLQGMAIFKSELDANTPPEEPDFISEEIQEVDSLPEVDNGYL